MKKIILQYNTKILLISSYIYVISCINSFFFHHSLNLTLFYLMLNYAFSIKFPCLLMMLINKPIIYSDIVCRCYVKKKKPFILNLINTLQYFLVTLIITCCESITRYLHVYSTKSTIFFFFIS